MKELGTIHSCALPGTAILPRPHEGYITPEPITLTEEGQIINFVYEPIVYDINYNLDGGHFIQGNPVKVNYTINDEYEPPIPEKEGYYFGGWIPSKIEVGSIGNVTFSAIWLSRAKLITGEELHQQIVNAIGSGVLKEVVYSVHRPNPTAVQLINVSSTTTPIFMWFNHTEGILYFYADKPIYCNENMVGAFAGFENLINIEGLSSWITEGADVTSMFEGCISLADVTPIYRWTTPSKFNHMLKNTPVVEASMVPSWFKKNAAVLSVSKNTGETISGYRMNLIPDQKIYPSACSGYTIDTTQYIEYDLEDEIRFEYDPIRYNISYELDGGELPGPKLYYTIEDERYTPARPIKAGYTFDNWVPRYIEKGETGNKTFTALYHIN